MTHIPTKLSTDSSYIRTHINERTLVNGAAVIDNAEMLRYARQEGGGVYVIDHETLCKATSGVITLDTLDTGIEHPLVVPFLGSEGTARVYIPAHETRYNIGEIGIWYNFGEIGVWFRNDLSDNVDVALGRLFGFGDSRNIALCVDYDLSNNGRVFGAAAEPRYLARSANHVARIPASEK